GRTPSTSASALAWTRQGKPSQVAVRMQALNGGVASARRAAQGGRNGRVAGGGEVVGELLDAWLVADRREGVGSAGGWLGRVLAAGPVDLIALLGQGVVGLELVVGDRPG